MASTAILTTRATVLFASTLSVADNPTTVEAAVAMQHAVRRFGGIDGCTAEVAEAYGERPEIAARRMRWARRVAAGLDSDLPFSPG